MLCAHSTAPLLYRRGKSHTCAPRWRPRWAASVTAPPRLHRPPSAGPCLPAWRSTPRRCCATCASTCPGSRASAFRSRCAAKASLTRSCARSCEAIDVYQFKHGQSNPTYCVIASVSVCGGAARAFQRVAAGADARGLARRRFTSTWSARSHRARFCHQRISWSASLRS
jgi:hypothetical protein